MRRAKGSGGRLLCFLINMLFNLDWLIPSVIFLVLHGWLRLSIWFFWVCFALWLLIIAVMTFIIGWAADAGNEPEVKKENKNPYSANKNPYSKKNGM